MLTPSFFVDSLESKKQKKSLNQHNFSTVQKFRKDDPTTAASAINSSDEKSSISSTSSFKLNKDHCLNIFNSIKNFNERLPPTSAEKGTYFTSLEQINERDEDLNKLSSMLMGGKDSNNSKPAATNDNKSKKEVVPPQSLKDIFKISNKNRKKNK